MSIIDAIETKAEEIAEEVKAVPSKIEHFLKFLEPESAAHANAIWAEQELQRQSLEQRVAALEAQVAAKAADSSEQGQAQ